MDGRDGGRKLIRETGVMLDRVERLVMKDGGIIETLEAAAERNTIRADGGEAGSNDPDPKEMGNRIVNDARAEQNRTVGTVNLWSRRLPCFCLGLSASFCASQLF